jgi:hypothetical protein
VETKNTIPLWLAIAITVVVSLPFGLWLGSWGIPLWVAFVTWAEYFALGAKPSILAPTATAYLIGVVECVAIVAFTVLVGKVIGDAKLYSAGDIQWAIGLFIGFCVFMYAMKYIPQIGGANTLPYFNGITMVLALFFTGGAGNLVAGQAGAGDGYTYAIWAGIGAAIGGILGLALGWFNVTILFPREVPKTATAGQKA